LHHKIKCNEALVICAVPQWPSAKDVAGSADGKKSSSPLAPTSNPEDEDREEHKRRDASWKAMKYSLIAFGATFGIIGSYMVYELGIPKFCWVKVKNAVWVSILSHAYVSLSLLLFNFVRLYYIRTGKVYIISGNPKCIFKFFICSVYIFC
jgi:hypothetical protein